VFLVGSALLNALAGFAGKSEFTESDGVAAKSRLSALSAWPDGVDTGDVHSASYKGQYSRDSFSSWYRIELTSDAASEWMEHIHALSGNTQVVKVSIEPSPGHHRFVGKLARRPRGGDRRPVISAPPK
jgi:hypothetical protein